jgi:hypothetical protein
LYTNQLNQAGYRTNAGVEDVTNYHCDQDNIFNLQSSTSKSVMCVRAYRKYEGLFDVKFASILLGDDNQTLLSRYTLQGISQELAQAFYQKFVEQVSWK